VSGKHFEGKDEDIGNWLYINATVLQMWMSALSCAKGFFEIHSVYARTTGREVEPVRTFLHTKDQMGSIFPEIPRR